MHYFVYCRRSQDREDRQTLSIEAQKRKLREYAKREELDIVRVFEENRSAYKRGRPVLADMLSRLEEGEAEAILTFHMTRLARNSFDGGYIIQLMDENIIKEIRTPESVFLNKPDDKFMMQIHFAMSKKSSDDTSSFVTRDIETKLLKGEYPGIAPLGYLNIDENGKIAGKQYEPEKQRMLEALGRPLGRIEIDPVTGPLVRRLFEEASKGVYSIRRLCNMGKAIGIHARRGEKPAKSTIYKTLTNPFYYGVIRYRGVLYVENVRHEALVNKQLFNRVQTMIDRRGTGGQRSHVFAYTGLMRCGECGCSVTAEIQRNHVYYHCTGTKKHCSQRRFVREEALEEQLKTVLMNFHIPQAFLAYAFEKTRKTHAKEATLRDTSRRSLERSYDECKRRLDNLLQLKLSPKNTDGRLLSDDEYLAQKQKLREEMDTIERQIHDQKDQGMTWIDDCEQFICDTQEFCRRMENGSLEEKRELFLLVCSNMTFLNGVLSFSYAEPFKSVAEFALAQKPSLERQTSLPEKQELDLTLRWRDRRDLNPRPPQ